MPNTPNSRGRPRRVSTEVLGDAPTPEPAEQAVIEIPTVELLPDTPAERPKPDAELTPEQRRIRDLENQLALERGKKDVEPELETVTADNAETIVIHFLEDGLTSLGKVWPRGQELEFVRGGQAYRDTCDRQGRSWVELRDNEFAQVERF